MRQTGTLKMRSGGGIASLFGLPFILMPTFMAWAVLRDGFKSDTIFILGFLSIFLIVGVALTFGRKGVNIDPGAQTVTTWWGLLFLPLGRTTRRWDEFEKVRLSTRVIRSKDSSRTVYPVELMTPTGEGFKVSEPENYQKGRANAERVAKFLDFGMLDQGGEVEVFREAGTLDESVRDRMRRTGEKPEARPRPVTCSVLMDVSDNDISFQFHEAEMSPAVFAAGLLFFAGFLGFVCFMMSSLLPLLLLAFAGPGAFMAFREHTGVDNVSIDRNRLTRIRTGPAGTLRHSITLDQLEELEISPHGNRIVARSDDLTLTIGSRLGQEESQWIVDTLKLAMAQH